MTYLNYILKYFDQILQYIGCLRLYVKNKFSRNFLVIDQNKSSTTKIIAPIYKYIIINNILQNNKMKKN